MAFTTQTFIFIFFPQSITLYYVCYLLQSKSTFASLFKKYRICDLLIIGISAYFYLWACFDDIFRFVSYILLVWMSGNIIETIHVKHYSLVIENREDHDSKKLVSLSLFILFFVLALIVFILIHFKYTALLVKVWNYFFKDTITAKSYLAPLGISFITFSSISYLVDIYKEKAKAGSLIDCTLYLLFFPKVVSGPIVLWRDFANQIKDRKVSLDLSITGANRIMIGFAKKLILADTFGACIASAAGSIDIATSWGIALLYMLQIYYDFSGYSDIAIGLSNMLGFSFSENFNFPYLSLSITEFWRRWHISLGKWFREYIYFPLGGNRRGQVRTLLNVGIVFLLTGLWHGAGWTYMLWGIINGLCNILEKLISDKSWYKRTPNCIKWFVTMFITYFCWELFRFNSITSCIQWLKVMFGIIKHTDIPYSWLYYFDARMSFLTIIAIVGATLFGLPKVQQFFQAIIRKPYGYAIQQVLFIVLFIIACLFMVNSTYSPFIYFQY